MLICRSGLEYILGTKTWVHLKIALGSIACIFVIVSNINKPYLEPAIFPCPNTAGCKSLSGCNQ